MRALAIADGEHYAPVVRDALAALPYDFVAVWLAGGTEKLRGVEDYGVPVVDELEPAIAELEPEVVVDLSDEPVLGPRERFLVASRVLALGLPYVGPDFRFDPPEQASFPLPSLSVVGTGKRVGKTAVTGHLARLLALDRDVIVVAMGRGGPPEPEVAEVRPTLEHLLELSREGRHAASDYLETAALAGVVTIGCRRCGGGLAGAPGESNVLAGAALAADREPDLVVFDGSGASIPPVETSARVLVTSAAQPVEVAAGYLNAYRILVSDLVVLTGAEEGSGYEELEHAIRGVKDVPVVPAILRPRPSESILGRRVAYFSTAPAEAHETLARHLREEHGAEVVLVCGNLAHRNALREDVAGADAAEVFLVEIKAAAIDVVAEAAVERGAEVVFADNQLVPVGVLDLDTELIRLADSAIAREVVVPR
jgi:cyclic 2,3-diphosphoglycerate synthase